MGGVARFANYQDLEICDRLVKRVRQKPQPAYFFYRSSTFGRIPVGPKSRQCLQQQEIAGKHRAFDGPLHNLAPII